MQFIHRPLQLLSLFTSFFLVFNIAHVQHRYWQRHVSYPMEIDMSVEKHQVSGKQKVVYTNDSPNTVNNAFKHGIMMNIDSSFLPSDLSAVLFSAQLEICSGHYTDLKLFFKNEKVWALFIPNYATKNAHMFYLVCSSEQVRSDLIAHIEPEDIYSVFQYQSLYALPFLKRNMMEGRYLQDLPASAPISFKSNGYGCKLGG